MANDDVSYTPAPETQEEYYRAMQVFAMMPENATKGEIRDAIQKVLMMLRLSRM